MNEVFYCIKAMLRRSDSVTLVPEPYDFAPPSLWADAVGEMLLAGEFTSASYVLDAGCGPGRFLPALGDVTKAQVIGLDSSMKMLEVARNREGARFPLILADANALPMESSSLDLVFFRYLLHHLPSPAAAIFEACRVLKRGGLLLIETSDPDWLKEQPEYIDFPEIADKDLARWPDAHTLEKWMNAAGLALLRWMPIHLVRGQISRQQFLTQLEHWKRFGGGTSFWRMFDEDQRTRFADKKKVQIAEEGCQAVPIYSHGCMILARKP